MRRAGKGEERDRGKSGKKYLRRREGIGRRDEKRRDIEGDRGRSRKETMDGEERMGSLKYSLSMIDTRRDIDGRKESPRISPFN